MLVNWDLPHTGSTLFPPAGRFLRSVKPAHEWPGLRALGAGRSAVLGEEDQRRGFDRRPAKLMRQKQIRPGHLCLRAGLHCLKRIRAQLGASLTHYFGLVLLFLRFLASLSAYALTAW